MNLKKIVAALASIGMILSAAVIPMTASAQYGGFGTGDPLGQYFVLDRLFNGPFGTSGPFTSYGDVLLWNQLLNGGYGLGAIGYPYGYGAYGGLGYGGYGGYGNTTGVSVNVGTSTPSSQGYSSY